MGNIIEKIKTKSIISKKPKELEIYFDSGSPFTFISEPKADKLGGVMNLTDPVDFDGLGNGKFYSSRIILLWFNLLGIWCRHLTFVVDKDITGNEDILCGHDFMQVYDIKLDLKKRKIILNKNNLLRAQIVRIILK